MAMEPIKNVSTSATGATSELQEIKKTEAAEVKSTEAKALDEAKTNENAEVSVAIADAQPKEEKKGFFAKLWEGIKSLFSKQPATVTSKYDKNGRLVKTFEDPDADGKTEIIKKFKYDDNGNLLSKSVRRGIWDVEYTNYKYDKNGNLIKEVNKNGLFSRPSSVAEFEYDNNGNKIKSTYKNKHGEADVTTYEYDKNNNLIKQNGSIGYDEVPDTIHYEYDTNGNLTKESIDYSADGELDRVTSFEYNEAGQVTKKVVDELGDDVPVNYQANYEYDENGNEIKLTQASRNLPEFDTNMVTENKYDENGNKTLTMHDDNADGVYDRVFKYEYDENGNLIKQISDFDTADNKVDITEYSYKEGKKVTSKYNDVEQN